MKAISQHFSGIQISSLRELIFEEKNAIVIYKTGTNKDLGYLESFFEHYIKNKESEFYDYMNNTINWMCPGRELCTNACMECLIINKHCCNKFNNDLDRRFFSKLIEKQ